MDNSLLEKIIAALNISEYPERKYLIIESINKEIERLENPQGFIIPFDRQQLINTYKKYKEVLNEKLSG